MTKISFPKGSPLIRICEHCSKGRKLRETRHTVVYHCSSNASRCLENLEATVTEQEEWVKSREQVDAVEAIERNLPRERYKSGICPRCNGVITRAKPTVMMCRECGYVDAVYTPADYWTSDERVVKQVLAREGLL